MTLWAKAATWWWLLLVGSLALEAYLLSGHDAGPDGRLQPLRGDL